MAYGYAGRAVGAVVESALALARLAEGFTGGGVDRDKLSADIVSAGVQGYMLANNQVVGGHSHTLDEERMDHMAEQTAFHRVMSAANSSIKLNDMLNETAQAVVAVTHADICSIFLYEPERDQLVLTATSDRDAEEIGQVRLALGEGITGVAALIGSPIAVRNAQADPRFKHVDAQHVDTAVSILAVPVVLFRQEKLVGAITVRTFTERDFSLREIQFLETVSGEIAMAIENARLYEQTDAQLQQKVAELTTLQGVSAHIASTLNLSEVLALVAHQAAHLVHADAATIYAFNPDEKTLEQVAEYDLRDPHHSIFEGKIGPHSTLDVESSAIAKAVLRGIPALLPPDTDAELGLGIASEGYKAMFCVPLVAPRGIMGGICLYDLDERTFSEDQIRLLDAFAHEAAIALENSRLYEAAIHGLQIKSAMLREMNHRVRNNMASVASLLDMQLRRLPPDSEAATALNEGISRIRSIAVVHDLLVRRDVVSTSVFELAQEIAEADISTLCKPDFKLKLEIERKEAESIRIRSHEATILALVLNELISNAILHGFAGLKQGELRIRAWLSDRDVEGQHPQKSMRPLVHVTVSDNGTGLPRSFDFQRSANLGLSLVRNLVGSELRGEFEIKNAEKGRGTVAYLRFPLPHGE
jgi:two-component sensor histidine kinase